jgi:hypothetical protein
MSFWSSEDKIPVRQTKVSIPAENGLEYTSGQTINFIVPPNISFIQPKETYLHVDVNIEGNTAGDTRTRLMLDKMGGSVLIRDIRVYSGGAGGTLLEEIQNYNTLTALRYSYEQNDSLRNKRCLVEGAQQHSSKTRSTLSNDESDTNEVVQNMYFNKLTDALTNQTTAHAQRKVKCLLPLHTGIFQNDKVFPCMLTEGLRVEILLEAAPRCLVPVSQVCDNTKLNQKCIFHSMDGIDDNIDTLNVGKWDSPGGAVAHFFVRRDNSQSTAETFPFVIGESFDLVDMTQNQEDYAVAGAANTTPAIMAYTTADGNPMAIAGIQHYGYSGNSAAVGGEWGLTKITLQSAVTRVAGTNTRIIGGNSVGEACWVMVSRTLKNSTAAEVAAIDYRVSDVELIIQEVEMPGGYTSKLMNMMKEGGSLNYDFLSFRNYKYSALSADTQVNMRLPLVESRAKSILCVPTDSEVYTNKALISGSPQEESGDNNGGAGVVVWTLWTPAQAAKYAYNSNNNRSLTESVARAEGGLTNHFTPNFSQRSGLVGIWDFLTNYQLFYDGKLNPSRKVDCKSVATGRALSQQWAIEGEKALAMAGIRPLSFRDLHENAFIGRALSLGDGVYDCRGKDFNLQLAYEGASNADTPVVGNKAPVKNKLWNNYVAHLRRLVIKGNQISLEV